METENKNIEKVIKEGLNSPTFDLAIDYSEIALDSFIENEAINQVPIIKTIIGVVKGGLKIKEIFFTKKLMTFLKEYHSSSLSDDKKAKFQEKFNSDKNYRNSVVEQIMVLNERFLQVKKSKILANLFSAHINDKFNWETFCSLAVCLDNLHLSGISLLEDLEQEKEPFYKGFSHGSEEEALLSSAGIIIRWGTHLQISGHGQYLYFYGIKGDIDYIFPKQTENEEK